MRLTPQANRRRALLDSFEGILDLVQFALGRLGMSATVPYLYLEEVAEDETAGWRGSHKSGVVRVVRIAELLSSALNRSGLLPVCRLPTG
jgi:hypothetical protein